MTKQEFLEIQSEALVGEEQLKSILAERKVPYYTYNYWRNRFTSKNDKLPIAPISIKESNVAESHSTLNDIDSTGVILAFPNGLRVV